MVEGEGDEPPGEKRKSGKKNDNDDAFFKPYMKAGYKRVFPDNAVSNEFTVFVVSSKEEKIGNNNPLMLANLFKNEIKGVVNIKRMNAHKVGVIFSQVNNANNFLKNEDFLTKHDFKAYIPASSVETTGVLRFVPTSISNEELFKKLTCNYEIIGVRRFTKRVDGEVKPFTTVCITFRANSLPECVYLDIFRFRVHEYNAPLLQCYKCFKFNHGAKICRADQICSICAGEHHYSQCKNESVKKCANCGGQHLAISRECPTKKFKIEERDNKARFASYAGAAAVSKPKNTGNFNSKTYNSDYPSLRTPKRFNTSAPEQPTPTPQNKPTSAKMDTNPSISTKTQNEIISPNMLIDHIIKSDYILNGLVGALVTIGNSDQKLTSSVIKEILIKTLTINNG